MNRARRWDHVGRQMLAKKLTTTSEWTYGSEYDSTFFYWAPIFCACVYLVNRWRVTADDFWRVGKRDLADRTSRITNLHLTFGSDNEAGKSEREHLIQCRVLSNISSWSSFFCELKYVTWCQLASLAHAVDIAVVVMCERGKRFIFPGVSTQWDWWSWSK